MWWSAILRPGGSAGRPNKTFESKKIGKSSVPFRESERRFNSLLRFIFPTYLIIFCGSNLVTADVPVGDIAVWRYIGAAVQWGGGTVGRRYIGAAIQHGGGTAVQRGGDDTEMTGRR